MSSDSARTGITRDKHWPPRGACRCRRQASTLASLPPRSSSALAHSHHTHPPPPPSPSLRSLLPSAATEAVAPDTKPHLHPPVTMFRTALRAGGVARQVAPRFAAVRIIHPLHARGSSNGICNALRWAQWPRHGLLEMFGDGIGASGSCWPHTKKFLGLTFPNSREPRPSSTPSPAAMPPTRRHRPPRYERNTMDKNTSSWALTRCRSAASWSRGYAACRRRLASPRRAECSLSGMQWSCHMCDRAGDTNIRHQ